MNRTHILLLTLLAFTLISCGPSQAERATQTQVSANATAVSAAATMQEKDRVNGLILAMCADIETTTLEKGSLTEPSDVVWLIDYYPALAFTSAEKRPANLNEDKYDQFAIKLPSGEREYSTYFAYETKTLLCVQRLPTFLDTCEYTTYGQAPEKKTIYRYRADSRAYLIDIASSRLLAAQEFPAKVERCGALQTFKTDATEFHFRVGAVELEVIYAWAARVGR